MSVLSKLFPEFMLEALGWTLIHSLWQGALFAVVLALILIGMRRFSSHARYVISVLVLTLFAVSTICTFVLSYAPLPRITDLQTGEKLSQSDLVTIDLSNSRADSKIIDKEEHPPYFSGMPILLRDLSGYLGRHIPLIVTIWFLGVLLLLLRFLGSLAVIRRLRVYQCQVVPAHWQAEVLRLSQQIGLRKNIQLISSRIALNPMAIGVLKPTIIFPSKLFTALAESQITVILVHELAHLKRNDYLVNILQSLVEILYFYHPGIWWISANIRNERENCCDDIAVALTGEPINYARTLIQLQEDNYRAKGPALAFTGIRYSFKSRIERLLNQPTVFSDFREGLVTALILVVGILALGFGIHQGSDNQNLLSPLSNPWVENVKDTLAWEPLDDSIQVRSLPKREVSEKTVHTPLTIVSNERKMSSTRGTSRSNLKLLFLAIHERDLELVKFILEKEVDVDGTNVEGRTPLIEAVHEKSFAIAEALILAGADVNKEGSNGYTALLEASGHGLEELVNLLLEKGATINHTDRNGHTALMRATQKGHHSIIEVLIARGADMETVMDQGPNVLDHLSRSRDDDSIHLVMSNPKAQGIFKETIEQSKLNEEKSCKELLQATKRVEVYKMRELLKTVDPNCSHYGEGDPRSPLVVAARMGNLDLGKILVEAGADIEFHADGDESPLMAAAKFGHLSFVKFLVEQGADVNVKVLKDGTALLVASRSGYEAVVNYLLNQGAEVDATVRFDGTALINAVRSGHYDIAKLLLERGADPYLAVPGDEYPMYHARMAGDEKMIGLLKQYEK